MKYAARKHKQMPDAVHISASEFYTLLEALRSYGADKPYRLDVHDLIRDIHEITRK